MGPKINQKIFQKQLKNTHSKTASSGANLALTQNATKMKEPMAGFEPTTSRLLSGCSTAKLHWLARSIFFCPLPRRGFKRSQVKLNSTLS